MLICQKAPSAKRCIETGEFDKVKVTLMPGSESTERQKVH